MALSEPAWGTKTLPGGSASEEKSLSTHSPAKTYFYDPRGFLQSPVPVAEAWTQELRYTKPTNSKDTRVLPLPPSVSWKPLNTLQRPFVNILPPWSLSSRLKCKHVASLQQPPTYRSSLETRVSFTKPSSWIQLEMVQTISL